MGKVPVYTVKKIMPDSAMFDYQSHFIEEKDFLVVIKEDADVYTEDGELLLRFRKNVLSKKAIDDTYDALKDFMKQTSTDRGIASGSNKGLATGNKNPVMSNILGYFDKWAMSQKAIFRNSGIKYPGPCRLTSFTARYPEKWRRVIPLIKEIDAQYKLLCPEEHKEQRAAAKQTAFHIEGTAFSTVTTNLNFRTAAHTDSGDFKKGFGNLVVIEHGSKYEGAFTGFPQYGVAVDCRTGDFLAMDVHQVHGNSPLKPTDETSQRLSLVSYLREGILTKCKNQKMYDAVKLAKRIDTWRRKTMKLKKQRAE